MKNKRGLTPLAALLAPPARGRGAAAAANGADLGGDTPPPTAHQSTAALLRKLGATQ